MQIGDFHIGSADTAIQRSITVGEACMLWDNLLIRYDTIESFQLYYNYAHDSEFKAMIKNVIKFVLEPEIESFEQEMNKYQLVLPKRPPKSANFEGNSGVVKDEFIFRRIFTHVQECLGLCAKNVSITVNSDRIREIANKYLFIELDLFDTICKYGKMKGWLEVPPFFTPL